MLTDVKTGVGSIDWSPDGTLIAFLMSDPEPEEIEKGKKAKDDARVVDGYYRYSHLYTIAADVVSEERPEPKKITEGDFHLTSYDWSPDGKSFVVDHRATPKIDGWRSSDISQVSSTGGELTPLVRHDGTDGNSIYSPDGRTIAFVSDRGNLNWARHWKMCTIPATGGDVTVLAESGDGRPAIERWAVDGSGTYYSESSGTNRFLFFAPVDGSEHRTVNAIPGVWNSFDFSKDGSLVAFCHEDLNSPEEIYILPLGMGVPEPKKITGANSHLPQLSFTQSEVITWKGADGWEIEGILHYPLNYEEGKKYPLILNVHGGPAGVFSRTFTAGATLYPLEVLASKGFFVLRPNPRGSTGYGWKFRFANLSDWGGKDYQDLMAGVEYLIGKGMADPEHLGVMGWSYGGFMTSWVITQTDRFKAAAVGA